jgi:PAS domain S-box-containing protein
VAAEAATLAQQDTKLLERTLEGIRERNAGVRSVGVRRQDKGLVAQTAQHEKAWGEGAGENSVLTHISVPLTAGAQGWGSVEVSFVPEQRTLLERVGRQPLWITLLCVIPMGLFLYWVYMKRALVHLDPTAVIPQRVRVAFNVMTEGVAVLDRQGRILLANNALRALQSDESIDPVGKTLSSLSWLAPGLPADASEHPWNGAMRGGKSVTNQWIELHAAGGPSRTLVVNCAPIADHKGAVRGCLATFDDLTELHQANEQLSKTLTELQSSQEQIELKNRELEHLATHDVADRLPDPSRVLRPHDAGVRACPSTAHAARVRGARCRPIQVDQRYVRPCRG